MTTNTKHVAIPADFPNPHRLAGAALVRALTGLAESTIARRMTDGSFPKPDVKMGRKNMWRETTLAALLETGVA